MVLRTRIKFCGMTRAIDITNAAELGVDAIGLILYSKSKRAVSLLEASAFLSQVPPFLTCVAVLVNPSESEVMEVLNTLPIQCLQFHGEESPEFCRRFQFPYIKAISANNPEFIIEQSNRYSDAQALLLDTPSGQARGGTGLVFDWTMVPKDLPRPLVLAGGLSAENVGKAMAKTLPYGVDVCSGVEASPGIKSLKHMRAFIQQLRLGESYVSPTG